MRSAVLMVLALGSVLVPAVSGQTWSHRVILSLPEGMGGAAIGDLDSACEGNEVAAVTTAGEVWMASRHGDDWKGTCIHRGGGELIMCAIGDADSRRSGNELVAVGMVEGPEALEGAGRVELVYREGDSWRSETIFRDNRMLHGVSVGDVCPDHAGNEIVVCGFNHRVTVLHLEQGKWQAEVIYVGDQRMKITAIADVIEEHAGLEVVTCGTDGKVVLMWKERLGWRHETVFSDTVGQSRFAARANEILVGGDGGKVALVSRDQCGWRHEFIGRDKAKMRGVAIADLDVRISGSEYYGCGYSKNVTQFSRCEKGYWNAVVVFSAESPLHHLLVGDVDSDYPGQELVTCGYGGKLYIIYPPEYGLRG